MRSGSVNGILEGSAVPQPCSQGGRIRGVLDTDSRNFVRVLGTYGSSSLAAIPEVFQGFSFQSAFHDDFML